MHKCVQIQYSIHIQVTLYVFTFGYSDFKVNDTSYGDLKNVILLSDKMPPKKVEIEKLKKNCDLAKFLLFETVFYYYFL